ncbi:MAG: hypothetical protein RLZZ366_1711 [Pseudomonadota bacterium]|jgi:Protein of unknown function (DUF2442)
MVDISDAEIAAANERGRIYFETHPIAKGARYDAANDRVVVDLTNGCTFIFPPRLVQGLEQATNDEIAQVDVGSGIGLHWDELDVDVRVSGLMAGIFGTQSYMARLGGSTRSPAKAAAARANGKKGGRPRKQASA